jgi:hypothetical protein
MERRSGFTCAVSSESSVANCGGAAQATSAAMRMNGVLQENRIIVGSPEPVLA